MPTAPLALPPSIDIHQALGSPSGRAGAKRLRGLTAPIPPTNYPQIHCTDSTHRPPLVPVTTDKRLPLRGSCHEVTEGERVACPEIKENR